VLGPDPSQTEIVPTHTTYLEPTPHAGRAFLAREITGHVVMLNLLRFRPVADYSASPELAGASPMTGEDAYRLYVQHTLPFLRQSGGEVIFYGRGGAFLIGPSEERWDAVLLVRQASVEAFLAFAENPAYLSGMGHRIAALEDSRMLPIVEESGAVTEPSRDARANGSSLPGAVPLETPAAR
jgi:hypothetical protein